jgi:AcrR family transcriptional regulator
MGERAAQVDATRERILEAAISLYTELGISATSLREIGHRADVAPGTLRNHFPTRELLDAAIVDRLRAEAPLPELAIFDGAESIEERVRRLLRAAGTFTDQAARIYRMWLREPMLSGPWAVAGAAYGARWDELMRAALGPLADDPDARAILGAVLQPPFLDSVRAAEHATDEATALIGDLVAPWFVARAERR